MVSSTTLDVRGPRDGEFVRVNPDPDQRREEVLAFDDKGTSYLVADNMVEKVMAVAPPGKVRRVMIFVAQNSEGEFFLWPVDSPVPSDHPVYAAMHDWIAIESVSVH